MKRQEKFVITVNRELGSGGRTVGRKLAERLEVKYYDKALIQGLTKEFGLTVEEIEKIKAQKKTWWNEFNNYYMKRGSTTMPMEAETVLTTESMMATEKRILQELAAEESCVIVGRCGFHIFENHPNALKIFVHSSEDCRKRRIAEKYGLSLADAAAMVVDNDYSRELYTKTYTGKDWHDACNYDISLDVRMFGVNGAVDFIMHCIE